MNGKMKTLAAAACGLLALAGTLRAEPYIWTGAVGSDWFNPANWDRQEAPGAGADAVIGAGADVLLTNATAELASLTLTGGTLTFTNWETRIRATEILLEEGVLTHTVQRATVTNASGGWDTDGRVWLVCGTLRLAADAGIDVDGKGFIGGDPYPAQSPGRGPGGGGVGSGTGGGGGYGGFGYGAGTVAPPGKPYGDPADPVLPGSGGGASSDTRRYAGSPGGGVVRIDAAGLVVIDGRISANGGNAPNRGGAGSGGGILIRCGSFSGTNGLLRAVGGTSGFNGYGGGGRIAVVATNPVAQAQLSDHRVSVSTFPGGGDRVEMLGSLHVSHPPLLNGSWLPHHAVVSVTDSPAWAMDEMNVTGWIQVKPYGEESFFTLGVVSNITLAGPAARMDLHQALLTAGGSMSLTNGGRLFVYSSDHCPADADYGALVDLAGDVKIKTNSWVYLQSDGITGTSVLFRADTVLVEVGGGFNADGGGWNGATGDGKGVGGSWGSGGGYGGKGGAGSNGAGGLPYGSALWPMLPGSGGGRSGTPGGGLIRLEVARHVQLDGTLTARGPNATGRQGAGSGGAILVQCRTFEAGGTAMVDASGGGTASENTGGGGGGRIAVWYGERYANDLSASRLVVSETPSSTFKGTAVADGGEGGYAAGDPGTIRFIEVLPPRGTLFLLR